MAFFRNVWGRLQRPTAAMVSRGKWLRRSLWGTLFTALLGLLLVSQVLPQRLTVVPGEPAPRDIVAPRADIDHVTTEARARAAAAEVPVQFRVDEAVVQDARQQARKFFVSLEQYRARTEMPLNEKVADLSTIPPRLPEAVLAGALSAAQAELSRAESVAVARLELLLSQPVSDRDVVELQTRQDRNWNPEGIDDRNLQVLVRELVKTGIRPNLVRDEKATQEERARVMAEVRENPTRIQKGEKIVDRHKVVTPEKYELLRQLGVVGPPADNRALVGVFLFAALVVAAVGAALWRHRPTLIDRDSHLFLVGLTATLTLGLGLVVQSWSGFAMPLAAGTMLLTVLFDTQVGLVMALGLGLLTGTATGGDWPVAAVGILSSVAGVYSLRRVEQRTDIIRAGLVVAGAAVLSLLSLHLARGGAFDLELGRLAGAAVTNGLLSAVLTIGSLPFLESLFGIVTSIKLLELANPNHPLLRRLLVDAPGSYHHTILVANLSEAAAEAIGADPVLTRVGAYFHDIGKVKRPYFFTENQFGGENPHDKLPPHLSALIISQHVKEGVEMAREHRLPVEIIDFIREHHGDTLISFFYQKATENGQAEHVVEEDFRYEGPRPRSKETAICMLADGCEASVRVMRERGPLKPEQIEAQVQRIIQDRLQQGQLEGTDLTLRDLDQVGKAFVKVLTGVYHGRVEYPAFAAQVGVDGATATDPAPGPTTGPTTGPTGGVTALDHPSSGQ